MLLIWASREATRSDGHRGASNPRLERAAARSRRSVAGDLEVAVGWREIGRAHV